MELKLKSISPEGVDAALSKAELYRFQFQFHSPSSTHF